MPHLLPSRRSPRRLRRTARTTLAVLVVAAVQAVVASGVLAQPAPACQFQPDLAQVRTQIGTTVVGDCVQNEIAVPTTADRFQTTTRGLLIWSGAGWAAFTDGQTTWIDAAGRLATAGVGQAPAAQPGAVSSTASPQATGSPIGTPPNLPPGALSTPHNPTQNTP